MLVAGASRAFEAFQVAPGTPDAYWTVVDGDFMPVALADDYLRELRFGRRRTVSTTKAYAENLALFLDWADRSGCAVESAPRELGRFVHWLRSSPVERRGTGFGRARGGQRINTILVSVRELYKHAVSMGSLDGRVLDGLYVVGDDRFYPAHVRSEDGMLRTVLRPLHRVPEVRRASVDDAKLEEFQALLGACEHWRDRFLLAVMYFAGLRVGETLGLRLSDLHFAERSGALGCSLGLPRFGRHVRLSGCCEVVSNYTRASN